MKTSWPAAEAVSTKDEYLHLGLLEEPHLSFLGADIVAYHLNRSKDYFGPDEVERGECFLTTLRKR